MSPELRKYFKIAIGIYRNILELKSVEIIEQQTTLHWGLKSNIYPTSKCAFSGRQEELKEFLDELIS